MWRVGLIVIGFFAIPGAVQSAWAQVAAGQQGELQAVSYREVSDRLSLSIILYDDTDLDLEIRDQMVAALEAAKHSVGVGPLFELELTSEFRPAALARRQPSLGELSSADGDVELQMNVWSTTQDSLIGGRQSEVGRRSGSMFEISAILREKSGSDVIWEGHAIVGSEREQAELFVPRMVEALVQNIGLSLIHI